MTSLAEGWWGGGASGSVCPQACRAVNARFCVTGMRGFTLVTRRDLLEPLSSEPLADKSKLSRWPAEDRVSGDSGV